MHSNTTNCNVPCTVCPRACGQKVCLFQMERGFTGTAYYTWTSTDYDYVRSMAGNAARVRAFVTQLLGMRSFYCQGLGKNGAPKAHDNLLIFFTPKTSCAPHSSKLPVGFYYLKSAPKVGFFEGNIRASISSQRSTIRANSEAREIIVDNVISLGSGWGRLSRVLQEMLARPCTRIFGGCTLNFQKQVSKKCETPFPTSGKSTIPGILPQTQCYIRGPNRKCMSFRRKKTGSEIFP